MESSVRVEDVEPLQIISVENPLPGIPSFPFEPSLNLFMNNVNMEGMDGLKI